MQVSYSRYTCAFSFTIYRPLSEDETIKRLGFDDSKQLKEGERDKLFEVIRSHPSVGWVIEELTAAYISEVSHYFLSKFLSLHRFSNSQEMLRVNPISLNSLSYDAVVKILSTIQKGGRTVRLNLI